MSVFLFFFFFFFYRAMNYGVIGFLIAKDILHLILPESKRRPLLEKMRLVSRLGPIYSWFTLKGQSVRYRNNWV